MPGESLRDQLQSTYDALVERDEGNAPPAAEPVAADAAPEPDDAPAEGTAPVRDEHGRFAPKDTTAAAEAPKTGDTPQAKTPSETAKPEGAEPAEGQAIRVPPSLPAAVKAKFASLDPDVQQAFGKLEESVQTAKAEWAKKGERLNRFDEVIGPRREQLAIRGVDEIQALQLLFAAQDLLDRDPASGLRELARSYGVNLQALAQQMSGQTAAPGAQTAQTQAPGSTDALHTLAQQVQALQRELADGRSRTESEKLADAHRQVAEFAARPENLYWEDVKNDVALRLQANPNLTLADAYEQATWASPAIRPLLLQSHAAPAAAPQAAADPGERQRQIEEAARKKSEEARRAAGSVTGAPQGGAVAPVTGSTGNLRADLEAAFRAAS